MTDVNFEQKLRGAWVAIQEIKDEPEERFWDLLQGIEAELHHSLTGKERNLAIEAVHGYCKAVGRDSGPGYV